MPPPASSPEIPTISILPFLHPTSTPTSLTTTSTALSSACASPGFFYLTDHNLPTALTDIVLSHARTFFQTATPAEKKALSRREVGDGPGDGARGYQVVGENVTGGKRDWHEAVDWYRPICSGEPFATICSIGSDKNIRIHGNNGNIATRQPPFKLLEGLNTWPTTPPDFRIVYEEFVEQMLVLGTAVVRALGLALGGGMEDVFFNNTRESFWVMRAIGYPPLPALNHAGETEDADAVSCGAHTDYGCVTLLLADETKGALQAWLPAASSSSSSSASTQEQGKWINVDPVEGALVVNLGDCMERWSGGKWKATRHRVVHRGRGMRVSVPFFFEPDWGARVPGVGGRGETGYGEYLMGKVRGNF